MGRSLLLVDDDQGNLLTLSVLLEDEGFAVDVAACCDEARKKLSGSGQDYDLVLLDLHLGDGLGSELLPIVRRQLPAAKTILVSGSIAQGEVPPARFDAVIMKGTDFPSLLATVRKLLA